MKTTTDELLAFVAVADRGSITAAAEQLEQTISGVSRTLKRLEKKLESTLLHRTTRRLRLSEEGEVFLVHARKVLQALAEAEEAIAVRRKRPSGRLRVDASAPFMLHCIVPHIAEFTRLFPDIVLELSSSERNVDLLEQRTDIAIRIGVLQDSTLHARALGVSKLRIVASPAYLERHGEPQNASELEQHMLLGFSDPEALNHWPLSHPHGEYMKIVPDIAASSGETLRQLALAGAGITRLGEFMIGEDIRIGRLQVILKDRSGDHWRPINAVYYLNTALSARIGCFLDFIASRLELCEAFGVRPG